MRSWTTQNIFLFVFNHFCWVSKTVGTDKNLKESSIGLSTKTVISFLRPRNWSWVLGNTLTQTRGSDSETYERGRLRNQNGDLTILVVEIVMNSGCLRTIFGSHCKVRGSFHSRERDTCYFSHKSLVGRCLGRLSVFSLLWNSLSCNSVQTFQEILLPTPSPFISVCVLRGDVGTGIRTP